MELLETLLTQLFQGMTRKNWVLVVVFALVLILAATALYVFAAGAPPTK